MDTGLSIYGVASRTIKQSGYSYSQRKRVTYQKRGKKISYLRKTGKIIQVRPHERHVDEKERRFTFYGSAEQCREAKEKMSKEGWVPKRQYEDRIPAVDYTTCYGTVKKGFLSVPERYAVKGRWSTKETKAS